MPTPKRRKLSIEDSESVENSEQRPRAPSSAEEVRAECVSSSTIVSHSVVQNSNTVNAVVSAEETLNEGPDSEKHGTTSGCAEKESKRPRNKNFIEVPQDGKPKEEPPKPTRISERLSIKRNRLGEVEDEVPPSCGPSQINHTPSKKAKASTNTTAKSTKAATAKNKKPHHRNLWSVREQKLFFIYLNKCGKNFDAISTKLAYSAKMRGLPVKSKLKVRYFYYRCWGKISKVVNMSQFGVQTLTRELYGLVNYGVLRKYLKESDPQFARCLNELIHQGKTVFTIRPKGKKVRCMKLRTPICKCLKKLNMIEEKKAAEPSPSSMLPAQITLELTPKNHKAWSKVQEISHNPRVRFKLSANRTLESVFKYLGTKWKSRRLRLKEEFGKTETSNEELVCYLHPKCKFTPLTILSLEQHKVDVTFDSYRENILPTLVKRRMSKCSKDQEKTSEDLVSSTYTELVSSSTDKVPLEQANEEVSNKDACFKESLAGAESSVCASSFKSSFDAPSSRSFVNGSSSMSVRGATVVSVKPSAFLLEDENAMFPDSSKFVVSVFDPSSQTDTDIKPVVKQEPFIPQPDNQSSSSSSTTVTTTTTTTMIPAAAPSTARLSLFQPQELLSPSSLKKKAVKSSKKKSTTDTGNSDAPEATDDKRLAIGMSDNSLSPTKTEVSGPSIKELREESEREVERLSKLAVTGFTQENSNTVTLMHLSLMLGRESVIRLEYEWQEKKTAKSHLPPLFCQSTNQMANVLRRLCNIAALELIDFQKDSNQKSGDQSKSSSKASTDQSKSSGKSDCCSHCGKAGPARPGNSRGKKSEKREGVRDMGTMTDTPRGGKYANRIIHPPPLRIREPPGTFIATAPPTSLHLNRTEPVFRVPFVPGYPTPTREEQQRLQQARAIMDRPEPRAKLLKKRSVARPKKPIIVQRTLLPNVSQGQMMAYIQPKPGVQSGPVVVNVHPDNLLKIGQPIATIVNPADTIIKTQQPPEPKTEPVSVVTSSNIIAMAAQAAQISVTTVNGSPVKVEPHSDHSEAENLLELSHANFSSVTTLSGGAILISPVKRDGLTLSSQNDISMSDLDISMTSVSGSNLGHDAGDKFLDMVMQNKEQGFSGLIESAAKAKVKEEKPGEQLDPPSSRFDPSVLMTPPHFGISSDSQNLHFPSPIKLSVSDQSWISSDSQDVSLSAILGESSAFSSNKDVLNTPVKSSAFFGSPTSESATDMTRPSLNKPSFAISELSLGSLLGDPTLSSRRDENGVVVISNGLAPHLSSTTGLNGETRSVSLFNDPTSQDSFTKLDVNVTLQGMVNEGSLDFVSKFESLAAQFSDKGTSTLKSDGLQGAKEESESQPELEGSDSVT